MARPMFTTVLIETLSAVAERWVQHLADEQGWKASKEWQACKHQRAPGLDLNSKRPASMRC